MRQLVLIHGRAQEHKDVVALKREWLEALHKGLAKSGLELPVAEADVRFPYYGDTLFQLAGGMSTSEAAEIIVRGGNAAEIQEQHFIQEVLEEVRKHAGITKDKLAELTNPEVVERGPLNWEWVQGILRGIDRFVPHGSGASIALATRDVYQYLRNDAIRLMIDGGVAGALAAGGESVVVSHSLGTVVAYNLLMAQGEAQGWKVPQLITLGSPLGIKKIRETVRSVAKRPLRCPPCAGAWFNALDERDVVAIYPLTSKIFPLDPAAPAIENKTDVDNHTQNRHGISGYLDDAVVARRIHAALTAP